MSPNRKAGRRSPDFGVELPVPDAWREVVNALLQKRGDKKKLAKALGVSPGAISDVLNGEYKASSLVRPISEHFGVAVPMPVIDDEEMAALFYAADRLRTSNPEAFKGLLQTMLAMAGPPPEQPPRRHPKGGSNGQ